MAHMSFQEKQSLFDCGRNLTSWLTQRKETSPRCCLLRLPDFDYLDLILEEIRRSTTTQCSTQQFELKPLSLRRAFDHVQRATEWRRRHTETPSQNGEIYLTIVRASDLLTTPLTSTASRASGNETVSGSKAKANPPDFDQLSGNRYRLREILCLAPWASLGSPGLDMKVIIALEEKVRIAGLGGCVADVDGESDRLRDLLCLSMRMEGYGAAIKFLEISLAPAGEKEVVEWLNRACSEYSILKTISAREFADGVAAADMALPDVARLLPFVNAELASRLIDREKEEVKTEEMEGEKLEEGKEIESERQGEEDRRVVIIRKTFSELMGRLPRSTTYFKDLQCLLAGGAGIATFPYQSGRGLLRPCDELLPGQYAIGAAALVHRQRELTKLLADCYPTTAGWGAGAGVGVKAVLLTGEGRRTFARAAAEELKRPYVELSATDVVSSALVGSGESRLAELAGLLRAAPQIVLIFSNIDKWLDRSSLQRAFHDFLAQLRFAPSAAPHRLSHSQQVLIFGTAQLDGPRDGSRHVSLFDTVVELVPIFGEVGRPVLVDYIMRYLSGRSTLSKTDVENLVARHLAKSAVTPGSLLKGLSVAAASAVRRSATLSPHEDRKESGKVVSSVSITLADLESAFAET